ncbi:hypothetical protein GVN99_15465 [Serratia marcescens]|uniref:hypothetical protein n=1 Tax=Serratia TaxID=613 RepID=UPI0015727FBB|nr:hypothetical protein [Serratia marcescens]NSM20512.1 hypothetical protein [Serratia marcescens]NSM47771.1 hypothetical protein [Serratia marcescens]
MTNDNRDRTIFYMASFDRDYLLYQYDFYFSQAKKRIFSQFSDLDEAAKEHAEEWYAKAVENFNSDIYDEGDISEEAYNKQIVFYLALEEMGNTVYLSIMSSLYYRWEKDLREWIVKEMLHTFRNGAIKNKVWSLNIPDLIDVLESFGISITSKPFYPKLELFGKVVNVYKHGDGNSFKSLRLSNPEYFQAVNHVEDADKHKYINHNDLILSESQFDDFYQVIKDFWMNIPEYTKLSQTKKLPTWLDNLLNKV